MDQKVTAVDKADDEPWIYGTRERERGGLIERGREREGGRWREGEI